MLLRKVCGGLRSLGRPDAADYNVMVHFEDVLSFLCLLQTPQFLCLSNIQAESS